MITVVSMHASLHTDTGSLGNQLCAPVENMQLEGEEGLWSRDRRIGRCTLDAGCWMLYVIVRDPGRQVKGKRLPTASVSTTW